MGRADSEEVHLRNFVRDRSQSDRGEERLGIQGSGSHMTDSSTALFPCLSHMAALADWKIIRGAASREQCEAAATKLRDVHAVAESETYTEFKPSSIAADIAQHVHTVSSRNLPK